MGKLVNVVLPTGQVVAVPEAEAGSLPKESNEGAYYRQAADVRQEAHSGILDTARAGWEGAFDTATFGLTGKAVQAVGGDLARDYEARGQEHPYARMGGEVLGLLMPGSPAAHAGSAIKAGVAARTGSKALGLAAEGAAFGAGGHVAQTNVTGDPLTIEGTVEDAGIGAILNVGFGMAAEKVLGVVGRAKAAQTELDTLKGQAKLVEKGSELFGDNPAYNEAKAAYEAGLKQRTQMAKATQAVADDYTAFVGSSTAENTGKKFKAAVGKAENVLNKAEDYYAPANAAQPIVDETGRPTQWTGEGNQMVGSRREIKEPISPEKVDQLRGFRERISGVYKKYAGGWQVEGPNRWTKDPSAPADPDGAFRDFKQVQDELLQAFPKASKVLDDLPQIPGEVLPMPEKAKLPNSLREFAKQHAGTVEKLANSLDKSTVEAFNKLGADLGVEAGTPQELVAGVHKQLGEILKAEDAIREASKGATQQAGIISWMRKFARGAAGLALGRGANDLLGGGMVGAVGQVAAGDAARSVMGRVEESALANTLIRSKEGVKGKVRDIMAAYGDSTASAIEKLGPVTTYLATAFPSGEPDKEKDTGKQAVKRISEIAQAAQMAPDALYLAVQGMMGKTGDVAWKFHNQVLTSLRYLQSQMPKDPGLDIKMFESHWQPTYDEVMAMAHTMEAVLSPMSAIARALSGDGHPAATQTLWTVWPALLSEVGSHVAANPPTDVTYEKGANYSALLGVNMTALDQPEVCTELQSLYLPPPEPQMSRSKSPSKQPTGRPVGRPAAIQSPVAGSSYSGHISQQ